jgi:excisionase family DNA binding protein
MNTQNLLTANEVAEILQISPRTLASWRANNPNDLPFIRLGNRTIRYRLEDLDDFLESDEFEDDEYED